MALWTVLLSTVRESAPLPPSAHDQTLSKSPGTPISSALGFQYRGLACLIFFSAGPQPAQLRSAAVQIRSLGAN